MNHDWGLCAPHTAGVVARVALRREGDVQTADGAILQEVRFDAEDKNIQILIEFTNPETWNQSKTRLPLVCFSGPWEIFFHYGSA